MYFTENVISLLYPFFDVNSFEAKYDTYGIFSYFGGNFCFDRGYSCDLCVSNKTKIKLVS